MFFIQFGNIWSLRLNDWKKLLVEACYFQGSFEAKQHPNLACWHQQQFWFCRMKIWQYWSFQIEILNFNEGIFLFLIPYNVNFLASWLLQWFSNSCEIWNKFTTVSNKTQNTTNFTCNWRWFHIQNRIHLLRFRKRVLPSLSQVINRSFTKFTLFKFSFKPFSCILSKTFQSCCICLFWFVVWAIISLLMLSIPLKHFSPMSHWWWYSAWTSVFGLSLDGYRSACPQLNHLGFENLKKYLEGVQVLFT